MKRNALVRTAWGVAALAAALALAVGWPTQGDAARRFKVRVAAQQRTLDYVLAAEDWGKRYDLEIEIQHFASAREPMDALLAGRADVGFISPSRLMPVVSRQPGRWVVLGSTWYGSKRHSLSVAKGSPYGKLEDLKGKRLAARVGSGNYETFLLVIRDRGLTVKDFQIVNMNPRDMPAALQQGLVDGFLAWEPTPATSEVRGISRILMDFEGYSVVSNFHTASRDFLAKKRETAVRFLAAWRDAAELMVKRPSEAAELATVYQKRKLGVEVPVKVHELTLQRASVSPQIGPKEFELFHKEWEESGREWLKRGVVKSVPEFRPLLDLSVQEEAAKLRGS